MRQPPIREHVVRRGESLATIAASYGLASWQALYDAPCNGELRRQRANPALLQPGDRVRIPPDARQLAQARLRSLRALRVEMAKVFDRMERELAANRARVAGVGANVDTVAMVAGIVLNLGGFIKDASKLAKLSGDELTAANHALVGTHMKNFYDRAGGVAAQAGVFDVTGDEWEVWAFGKVVIKSWYDMTSPSYWAGVITKMQTGQTPQESFDEAQQHLEQTRVSALGRLDLRIRETERLLREATAKAPPLR
ncbi:MAG TPA: LysM domain-containing protein [Gemmatimonadaceae bacterium]